MAGMSALVYFIGCVLVTNSLSVRTSFDEHVTRSHERNYTMRWTIEDFSLVSITQKSFTSPAFPSNIKNGFKWVVVTNVKSSTQSNVGIAVHLQLVSAPKDTIYDRLSATIPVLYSFTVRYESTENENRYQKERFHVNKSVRMWQGNFDVPFEMKSDSMVIDVEVRFPSSSYDSVLSQLDENDRRNVLNTTSYHDEYVSESRSMGFSLKWTLEKFILGSFASEKDYLKSVSFPSDCRSGFKWLLEIDPASNEKTSTFTLRLLSRPSNDTFLNKEVPALCFFTIGYKSSFSHKHTLFRQSFNVNTALSLGRHSLIVPRSTNDADLVVEITVQVPLPKS